MKKILSLILALAVALTAVGAGPAAAQSDAAVTVVSAGQLHILYDGVEQTFVDAAGNAVVPLSYQGTTYLPIRAVAELAGLSVEWDGDAHTARLTSGGEKKTFKGAHWTDNANVSAQLSASTAVTLDGSVRSFSDAGGKAVYPLNYQGTIYLPVRSVCAMTGIAVAWEGETNAIYLGTRPAPESVYTSSKPLWWGRHKLYGLYTVNGEYYYPLAYFQLYGGQSYGDEIVEQLNGRDNCLYMKWSLGGGNFSYSALPDYCAVPPEGKLVGTALQSAYALSAPHIPDSYNNPDIEGAILTLGERFPLVRLDSLKAYVNVQTDAEGVHVSRGKKFTYLDERSLTSEEDLVGEFVQAHKKGTDAETLRSIHDGLVNHMTYGLDEQQRVCSWYNNESLRKGRGICENYARLFLEMCIRIGVPCFEQTGDAHGAHAWNAVFLNGQWKYVDVTFDDPVGSKPTIRWNYYLVDGSALMLSHWWEGLDYPLKTAYDPAWESIDPLHVKSADDFRKALLVKLYHGVTPIRLAGVYGGIEVACMQPVWSQISGAYKNGCWVIDVTYF